MLKFANRFVLIASLIALMGMSGIAVANPINNSISRHQHPEIGFFKHLNTHLHTHQTNSRTVLGRLSR